MPEGLNPELLYPDPVCQSGELIPCSVEAQGRRLRRTNPSDFTKSSMIEVHHDELSRTRRISYLGSVTHSSGTDQKHQRQAGRVQIGPVLKNDL